MKWHYPKRVWGCWENWFAWHPVYLKEDGMWVWLEVVSRGKSPNGWSYEEAIE